MNKKYVLLSFINKDTHTTHKFMYEYPVNYEQFIIQKIEKFNKTGLFLFDIESFILS